MNFSEGLKIKVRVSDFNFRDTYPGVCSNTFIKSDSNQRLSFRSPSACFQIIRSSSEGGFFWPLVLSVRVCGSGTTDGDPAK